MSIARVLLAVAACGIAATLSSTETAHAVCDKKNSHPECGVWDTDLENPYTILDGGKSLPGTTIYRVCLVGKHPAVEIDVESGTKLITTLRVKKNASACRDVAINGADGLKVRSRLNAPRVRGTYLFVK